MHCQPCQNIRRVATAQIGHDDPTFGHPPELLQDANRIVRLEVMQCETARYDVERVIGPWKRSCIGTRDVHSRADHVPASRPHDLGADVGRHDPEIQAVPYAPLTQRTRYVGGARRNVEESRPFRTGEQARNRLYRQSSAAEPCIEAPNVVQVPGQLWNVVRRRVQQFGSLAAGGE